MLIQRIGTMVFYKPTNFYLSLHIILIIQVNNHKMLQFMRITTHAYINITHLRTIRFHNKTYNKILCLKQGLQFLHEKFLLRKFDIFIKITIKLM